MTSEIRTYLILELTTALGTLGLASAQIGPLQVTPESRVARMQWNCIKIKLQRSD